MWSPLCQSELFSKADLFTSCQWLQLSNLKVDETKIQMTSTITAPTMTIAQFDGSCFLASGNIKQDMKSAFASLFTLLPLITCIDFFENMFCCFHAMISCHPSFGCLFKASHKAPMQLSQRKIATTVCIVLPHHANQLHRNQTDWWIGKCLVHTINADKSSVGELTGTSINHTQLWL